MKKSLLLSLFFVCSFLITSAQNYTPVSTTGYNIDGIAENSPASTYTNNVLDGSDYVMYTQAYGQLFGASGGLPNNGSIVNANHAYRLQPYDTSNVLRIMATNTDSLTLLAPGRFAKISLLGFATEGAGNIDVTLRFSDGSSLLFAGQALPDWFTGSGATVILNGFDRAGRTSGTPGNLFNQPYMYAKDFNITSCVDQAKNLEKIVIRNNGSNARICILAISGVAMSTTQNVDLCDGDTLNYNAHSYFAGGVYTDTLLSSLGCDSIVTTNLTIHQTYTVNNPQSVCQGSSYSINGHTYTTAGTYNDTLQSMFGCDSVIITNLTITTPSVTNQSLTICQGSSYTINGHSYTDAGTYSDTLLASGGCDSVVITNLTVTPAPVTSNPQTICSGDSYSINGHVYTLAGSYTDTLQASGNCDSIVVTVLTVNPTQTVNNPQTICSGSSYTINNHTYTSPGTYSDTLQNSFGCDSVIVTILNVTAAATYTNLQNLCEGNSYSINGHVYTTTGTYIDTLSAVGGCDSVIITILMVDSLPAISFNIPAPDDTLCNNEAAIILSATPIGGVFSGNGVSGATFNPSITPSGLNFITYTVTNGGCKDSASAAVFVDICTNVPLVNTDELISVYPNPATDAIYINVKGNSVSVTLMTVEGRIITRQYVSVYSTFHIADQPAGIYLLKVDSEAGVKVFRMVKE